MAKKLVSLISAVLLLLAMCATVSADETEIVGLGTFTAGQETDIFINKTAGGTAELIAGEFSQGLEIQTENREDGAYFYLRGTPLSAGAFSFTLKYLDGAGSFVTEARYSLNINPASPVLSYEKTVNAVAGTSVTISVNASVSDAGTLSCRWLSGSGGDSMKVISGQTGFSIVPDTAAEGTYYYRCEVTNTNNSLQATTLSEMICVNVTSPLLTGISINTMPAKQEYNKGERVDTEGLKLSLSFSNGTSSTVSEGYTVSPTTVNTVGTQQITVSYKNHTCSYPVLVSEAEETVKEIKVISLPEKTEYAPGETISLDGLKVRVITDKETKDIITGFFCTPTTFYEEGKQTVTVFYGDAKTTFDILVKNAAETTPTPSPSASPTPAPVTTPQPEQTAESQPDGTAEAEEPATDSDTPATGRIEIPDGAVPETKEEDSGSRSVSRLTVAIVIVAMVALVCLGVYVYVMQNPKLRKKINDFFSKMDK